MAVSNIYTLEDNYGSRVVVRGAGYILNNEMGDFNTRPGVTTTKGRIGTAANLVAPGKRMLSSQCPTVIARDGKVVLVTGSPGGRAIINTVLCVVVNTIDFEMDVRAAIDAPVPVYSMGVRGWLGAGRQGAVLVLRDRCAISRLGPARGRGDRGFYPSVVDSVSSIIC